MRYNSAEETYDDWASLRHQTRSSSIGWSTNRALRQPSGLTTSDRSDYRERSAKITTLYRELDHMRRANFERPLRRASWEFSLCGLEGVKRPSAASNRSGRSLVLYSKWGRHRIGSASWPQEFSWFLARALSLRSESSTSSIRSGAQSSLPATPRSKSAWARFHLSLRTKPPCGGLGWASMPATAWDLYCSAWFSVFSHWLTTKSSFGHRSCSLSG